MNKHKLFSYPIIIIGIALIILGARWMLVDKPWLLDETANLEKLDILHFDELFTPENKTLPGYLTQIYRFFGFWVIIIGLFLSMFSSPTIIKNTFIAKRLIYIVGFMLFVGTWLCYSLIPSSHFVYLSWMMIILYSISIYAYLGFKNNE